VSTTPAPFNHRFATAAAGLALLLGCQGFEPVSQLPDGAISLTAPASYLLWWDKTQDCSGLTADFAGVDWYVVPGVATFPTEDGEKVGLWIRSGGATRIIIAGDYRDSELVVRHEILHELLGREGHPEDYFRDRCRLTWDTFDSETQIDVHQVAR